MGKGTLQIALRNVQQCGETGVGLSVCDARGMTGDGKMVTGILVCDANFKL